MSHIEIKPIGSVLTTDVDGNLVSQSSVDKMVEPWKSAAFEAVELAKLALNNNLHSAYVRGSASRGEAVDGVSDLDIFLLVYERPTDEPRALLSREREKLQSRFPFATKVELSTHGLDRVLNGADVNWIYFKIYSACLYGESVIPQLPKVRPGRSLVMFAPDFFDEIEQILTKISRGERHFSHITCTWMMKRMLRTGFELVMERENVFARDLYPCYALFAKYYPDKEPQMRRVLEYALNPTDELSDVKDLVWPFARWLEDEAKWQLRLKEQG